MSKCVCVTGASGFISSHIVAQCLEKGYKVKATVRDASDASKTEHLKALPGSENLSFHSVELTGAAGRFDEAVAGCEAVIHTATPVMFGTGAEGKAKILEPTLAGTEELLGAVKRAGVASCFVLTSSMSSVAPCPEPTVKTEEHWSDDAAQEERGNWYGCTKTRQEKMCAAALSGSGIRFVAICPTGVFGPMLQPGVNGTMGWVASMAKNGPKDGKAANDSMSFVDVRDCAQMHVLAVENASAEGRYMCVAGTATDGKTASGATIYASTHWNDIYALLKQLHPSMPDFSPCDGEPIRPTQFDLSKSDALLPIGQMRDVPTILKDSLAALKHEGAL